MNATLAFRLFGHTVGSIRLDIDISSLFGPDEAHDAPLDRAAKRISRRWVKAVMS